MSILLDHCVPHRYLRLLRSWGYSTSTIEEYIRRDAPDSDVIQLAQQLDAVLLTVDLDFSNILDYPPQDYTGIIVMRYTAKDEEALSKTLEQALLDLYRDALRGVLVVVTPDRYRIRHSS